MSSLDLIKLFYKYIIAIFIIFIIILISSISLLFGRFRPHIISILLYRYSPCLGYERKEGTRFCNNNKLLIISINLSVL